MKFENIYIYGTGGLSRVVTDIINKNNDYKIVGYIDKKSNKNNNIISLDDFIKNFSKQKIIVAVGENIARKNIYSILNKYNHDFPNIISKNAIISDNSELGIGNIIMPNAIINTATTIMNFNILNTSSVVEHDCKLSSFVTLSPGSIICGGCNIEEGVFLGSNSTTIENLTIHEWSVIGAGSTVIKNLTKFSLNIGSPTKFIKSLNKDYRVFR